MDEANRVQSAFCKHMNLLQEAGIREGDVTPDELREYFAGETPTGDTTTLNDVVSNKWLLVHELVELKQLKLKGFEISRRLVWDRFEDVLEAHFVATETELDLALKHNDLDWVLKRIGTVESWLEDPDLAERFRTRCERLLEEYGIIS